MTKDDDDTQEKASQSRVERRQFLGALAVAGCTGTSRSESAAPRGGERLKGAETPDSATSGVPRRELGSTGERVSALGLGGYHLGVPSKTEALRIMHRAIDEGMTFFDNCWDYHDGESERRMGEALRGAKRHKVFLMSKIDGRNRRAAAEQIDTSLKRLQTEQVDLMQIHEVVRTEDPEWVFREGAVEALLEARAAGKIRFVGFTGHKSPTIHLSMLEQARKNGFSFDAVQMPLNVLDPHFESFEERVLPRLNREGIAPLGMKPLASGYALKSGVVSAEECLRYALSLPVSVVITGCDKMGILEQALRVGRTFQPLGQDERQALLARTAPHGTQGALERFKTTEQFDATSRNRHWLTTGSLEP